MVDLHDEWTFYYAPHKSTNDYEKNDLTKLHNQNQTTTITCY